MKTVSAANFSGKQEVLPVDCRAEGPHQCIFVSESQALGERIEKLLGPSAKMERGGTVFCKQAEVVCRLAWIHLNLPT